MTSIASGKNKNFSSTEEALDEASKLLTRLCKSRKAPMRLKEITDLTGVVARLTRSLQLCGNDRNDDGYGDREYHSKISTVVDRRNIIR